MTAVEGPLLQALRTLAEGRDLTADVTAEAVAAVMSGEAPDAVVAAFLAALRVKGETAAELAGAVRVVRERMERFEGPFPPLLDTCGTGGDGSGSVNVSTAAALVTAACGVPVAKHGNRSATGNSGSAEVLAELGIAVDAPLEILRRCLTELGITFLFAPRFHPSLRFAAPVRRLLPFRTLFNLIGPLANPASPSYQLVGTPGERQADLLASVLAEVGVTRAAVVTGDGGLDEVSLAGPTRVTWVEEGRLRRETWDPGDFGLPRSEVAGLRVSGPAESADRLRGVVEGEAGPVRDVVLANASAALLVAGRVATPTEGVALAAGAIDSGASAVLLDRWGRLSRGEG